MMIMMMVVVMMEMAKSKLKWANFQKRDASIKQNINV